MTNKVYKSAQGKFVDLGTIVLQNEHVRAVGNMKVNARGDKLDSNNRVIETKARQIQKQNDRTTTNVSTTPVHTSSKKARAAKTNIEAPAPVVTPEPEPVLSPAPVTEPVVAPAPKAVPPSAPAPVTEPVVAPVPKAVPPSAPKAVTPPAPAPKAVTPPAPAPAPKAVPPSAPNSETVPKTVAGGLAGAIARSREIKQDLERTRRQQAQDKGVRKI
jgi:hypothetical protein